MVKFITTIVLSLLAATQVAHADFIVWTDIGAQHSQANSAVDMNCDHLFAQYATADAYPDGQNPGEISLLTKIFHIEAGMCGASLLDVYHHGDVWDVYDSGGNGGVLGNCYPTSGIDQCGSYVATHFFYCYSYLCKRFAGV